MATNGEEAGQFVARCVKDECGYFSPLERFYDKQGLVRCYAPCAVGEKVPLKVMHMSETRCMISATPQSRPLKRTYTMLDINADAIPQCRPPNLHQSHKTAELLAKLDAREQPSITKAEFQRLFYRCECSLYVTHRAFMDHDCLNEIVDLTGNN
ncbi:hypothetical protein PILCRDRAFT_6730 [Piloderma croceum F 1598]|uniref:Uncharacterized protein n=1 Tax=Piloderma croceum (strain F 1598) TaxID=765440 RepID=A0A0C3G014_PILCF|nr:hypothetical protein PILCRDRAFT_6730 [Piloderma croceum F 1598]